MSSYTCIYIYMRVNIYIYIAPKTIVCGTQLLYDSTKYIYVYIYIYIYIAPNKQ